MLQPADKTEPVDYATQKPEAQRKGGKRPEQGDLFCARAETPSSPE